MFRLKTFQDKIPSHLKSMICIAFEEKREMIESEILPIAQKSLKVDDHLLFLVSKVAPFDPRPKVISPPKPATLAASVQA